jgi:hopene-associated glycosyltransferase HpnB
VLIASFSNTATPVAGQIALAAACLTLAIWAFLLLCHAGFWRVRRPRASPAPARWPVVVAVVPARNEAEVIAAAMSSLLAQDYPGQFEVVLVDDHSTDGTGARARAAADAVVDIHAGTGTVAGPHRATLTVVGARDLPAGWSGKVWAQSEGLAAADRLRPDAEFIWLTDADIAHGPRTLTGLVARAVHERRDLVSLMVSLRCTSWWERLIVPAFVFFFAMLYPFARVANPASKVAGAAGGCMLARRSALARIGGFAAIRGELIDDCSLAAKIKAGGHAISLDVTRESLSIRPYDDWHSLWMMIARSAYTQLHYSPLLLAGAVAGMTVTYLLPPILALGGLAFGLVLWPAWLAWAAMAVSYRPMLREYAQPAWISVLLPAISLFFLGATVDSARRFWQRRGGEWKGRAQAPHGQPEA